MSDLSYWQAKRRATPAWLSRTHRRQMADLYRRAANTGRVVDHIVPLRSPLVCGLNVPWNMEIMTPEANRAKSNDMWPGHPNEPRCWLGNRYHPEQLRMNL